MDHIISENLPFRASILVSKLANSSNLDVFHKVEEGLDKTYLNLQSMALDMQIIRY